MTIEEIERVTDEDLIDTLIETSIELACVDDHPGLSFALRFVARSNLITKTEQIKQELLRRLNK